MQPDKIVVYELKGESLISAYALDSLQQMTAHDLTRTYNGDKDAYKADIDMLLHQLGQKTPSTRISLTEGSAPRAYAHYPAVFFHPGDNTRAYMFAPVDFKGRYFMPADAVKLTENQAKTISIGLWAGGWSDPAPVTPVIPAHGIPMPMDFDRRSPLQNYEHFSPPFAADQSAMVVKVLNSTRDYLTAQKAIGSVQTGDEFVFKCQMTYEDGGRPGLIACAERKDNQARLPMKDNVYFLAERMAAPIGYYKITPNKKYAGGLALQSFLDAVPTLSPERIWDFCNRQDHNRLITPPKTQEQYLRDPKEPWPFPKNSVAPYI